MPDDLNNQSGAGANDNNAGTEGGQSGADNNNSDNSNAGGGDAGAGDGGQGGQKPDKGQDKNAKAPPDGTVQDDGAEPPTRPHRSPKDFIIQRQAKKLAKTKVAEADEDEGEDNDGDEVAPEDEALITKVVNKKFAPVLEQAQATADDNEIQNFLKDNPDFKPYEAKARRFIAHPSRRHLPIKAVFYEVAGDDLMKLGAARSKAADDKAKQTQTGGGSNRSGEGKGKSDWDLSPEEFAKKQEKIRRSQP